MTFNEMVTSVYRHSVGHVFNGQKASKETIRFWFDRILNLCDSESALFTMNFPDGEWCCLAVKGDSFGYDYIVPDTREQEEELFKRFLAS